MNHLHPVRQFWIGLSATLLGALLSLSHAATADSDSSSQELTPAKPVRRLGSADALLFRNGDFLYGTLASITSESGIVWKHADSQNPIEFQRDNITEIRFPSRTRSGATNDAGQCRVQLCNGDELEGAISAFDEEKLLLSTWYAGDVTLQRNMVQFVTPIAADGPTIFEGPSGTNDWIIGKVTSAIAGSSGQWQYRNGAFYATNAASIARDVKLPDVASVEFDMAWKGIFQLALALYTDYFHPINLANKETEPDFGGFYSLQLNSFTANLLPVKKNDPLRYLGQVSVAAFNQKNSAHIEILASKSKRSIWLLVDGQMVKQWTETEEFAGQGTGVRFVHQGQGKVKISHIRISQWDGQFEEKTAFNPNGKLDIAKLRNGDKVTGTITAIQSGKVTIATGGANLEIPINRVRQMEFAGQKVLRPVVDPTDVRALFARGGAVTFHLEKWDANKVTAKSPAFGQLAFDPTAFSALEFELKTKEK